MVRYCKRDPHLNSDCKSLRDLLFLLPNFLFQQKTRYVESRSCYWLSSPKDTSFTDNLNPQTMGLISQTIGPISRQIIGPTKEQNIKESQ